MKQGVQLQVIKLIKMSTIFKIFDNSENKIRKYLQSGKLNRSITKEFLDGLIFYIDLFLKEGFNLNQIIQISTIGQILADEVVLKKIKSELLNGTFNGGYSTESFQINGHFIDLMHIKLESGESYAIAYNSPGDYWGTFVGIIWILKLDTTLKIGEIPNTHIEFIK